MVDEEVGPVAVKRDEGCSVDEEDEQCLQAPVHCSELVTISIYFINLAGITLNQIVPRRSWSQVFCLCAALSQVAIPSRRYRFSFPRALIFVHH